MKVRIFRFNEFEMKLCIIFTKRKLVERKHNSVKTFCFCLDKDSKEKEKANQSLAVPRLSVCADAQKIDRAKLDQTEVNIIAYEEPRRKKMPTWNTSNNTPSWH